MEREPARPSGGGARKRASTNHPDDVEGMIHCPLVPAGPFMDRAIAIVSEGDGLIEQLVAIAGSMRAAAEEAGADAAAIASRRLRLQALDTRLTPLGGPLFGDARRGHAHHAVARRRPR